MVKTTVYIYTYIYSGTEPFSEKSVSAQLPPFLPAAAMDVVVSSELLCSSGACACGVAAACGCGELSSSSEMSSGDERPTQAAHDGEADGGCRWFWHDVASVMQ